MVEFQGTRSLKACPETVSRGDVFGRALAAVPRVLLILPTSLGEGGGSEKFMHTKHLSEKTPPLTSICAHPIWLTIVGGYMKGRKKSEIEKTVSVPSGVPTVGLGALLTLLRSILAIPFRRLRSLGRFKMRGAPAQGFVAYLPQGAVRRSLR